ncbi:MAG: hypothetical protein P9X24_10430 [Candidatus Hatepunaea meridiana]|nr:hypothetical protein [Candidatus Hatepunaea meridiana]
MAKYLNIFCFLFVLLLAISVYGQEKISPEHTNDMLQSRLIKVKRMSEVWEDKSVELRLYSGLSHSGRFLSIQGTAFKLQSASKIQEIPVMKVESIILKRKYQDLIFVGLVSVGVAALFGGGASLGFESSDETVRNAAIIGGGVGFAIGWKAFYQDIVIPLK